MHSAKSELSSRSEFILSAQRGRLSAENQGREILIYISCHHHRTTPSRRQRRRLMQSESSRSKQHHVNTASLRATPTTAGDDSDVEHSPTHRDKGKARALDTPVLDASASTSRSASPVGGRSPASEHAASANGVEVDEDADDETWCLICHTTPIVDRTVLPRCLHSQFCFACILRWISIKRRCPLCVTDIGNHVIHAIREDDDYVRYHLPPVAPTSSATQGDRTGLVRQVQRARAHRHRPHHQHTTPDSDTALAFRTHIYRHHLYASHVGSNRHTHYRPAPTPAQVRHDVFHGGTHIARRITAFVRRELQVWPYADVEFLTKYVLSLLQVFDVGQEETVKLVGEFLGEDTARHMLHELSCFLRSGKREVRDYDRSALLQYAPMRGRRTRNARESTTGVTVGEERGSRSTVPSRRDHDEIQESSASSIRQDVAARRANLLDRLERERALLLSDTHPPMPS